jgi:hypothetical protein
MPSTSHLGDAPLLEKKWRNDRKGKEKEDLGKGKVKVPTYRLQFDIESSIDIKGILEERILDAKIEFTLREALGIAKKDFHKLIIDVIKWKRQIITKTIMTKALDIYISVDEEYEISQVFASMARPEVEKAFNLEEEDYLTDNEDMEVWEMFVKDVHAECNLT